MNKIKNGSQGFTLIELLVVVLIIGILAAIALPQYQMAVGKSKFYQLKTMTKTVNEAVHRYYLNKNIYPERLIDLDIEIPQGDITCNTFEKDIYLSCGRNIFGVNMAYYIKKQGNKPYLCIASSPDLSHPANVLCAKDAYRISPTCGNTNCTHYY